MSALRVRRGGTADAPLCANQASWGQTKVPAGDAAGGDSEYP